MSPVQAKNGVPQGIANLRDLPVYRVVGGSGRAREDFARRLLVGLERRSITGAFLRREESRMLNRHGLLCLAKLYDLLLLDSQKDLPGQPLCLEALEGSGQDSLGSTTGDAPALKEFIDKLVTRLDQLVHRTPVWGCILIGGKSSRMGRPKHLLEAGDNTTWLERTAKILRPLVDDLVVSGAGSLPPALGDIVRLADIPGVVGPLTGILSACRWQPLVSWLVVACDMPHITREAIGWLYSERRAGCWGRVPRIEGNDYCEPLFAWYDFRAGQLFEEQLLDQNLRIGAVAGYPRIDQPVIPESLCRAWQNVNTPEQLQASQGGRGERGRAGQGSTLDFI